VFAALTFQTGNSKGRGGCCYSPYVFTEQGVAMLSSVLNSDRAVRVNIEIMLAFVRLRELLACGRFGACTVQSEGVNSFHSTTVPVTCFIVE
jgi:hypothetical protein